MTCKRLMVSVYLIMLFIAFAPSAQAEKIYIDIDSPAFRQFPLAVADFAMPDGAAGRTPKMSSLVPDLVRSYLALTGLFNILDKTSYLDAGPSQNPEKISFPDWVAVGADYLLAGAMQFEGTEMLLEVRLYDVVTGRTILHKTYRTAAADTRAASRLIAGDIVVALIGEEGDFDTRIAFVAKRADKSDIYSTGYDGEDLNRLTRHATLVATPRWSPDGRYLAFTSYKNGRPAVFIKDLKTNVERQVAFHEGLNLCGGFSPDSRKLLLTLSRDTNEEIYALDIDSLKLARLTYNYAIDVSPTWSPCGRKIAFVSNRSGTPQIFVMDADGNNVRRLTYEGNYNTSPAWSPRGGKLAFEGLIDRRFQIFTVNEDGEELTQLTADDANSESPAWSPSGRQIAFSSRKGSKYRLCVVNANGANLRVLREEHYPLTMPAWSPRKLQ